MPRMKKQTLEFGLNSTPTEDSLVAIETDTAGLAGIKEELEDANIELTRIRRANELIIDEDVEPEE